MSITVEVADLNIEEYLKTDNDTKIELQKLIENIKYLILSTLGKDEVDITDTSEIADFEKMIALEVADKFYQTNTLADRQNPPHGIFFSQEAQAIYSKYDSIFLNY